MSTKSKNTIRLNLYLDKETNSYKARILGVISEDEFHAIRKNSGIASRLSTAEAMSIAQLYELGTKVSGLRLLFAIREDNNKISRAKTLLVSDIVDLPTFYTVKDGQLGFSFKGTNKNWMILHEGV